MPPTTPPPTSDEIRRMFIEFFRTRCGHEHVASSSCAPLDDPTLLFTNAGMNQFKPIFLGRADPRSAMGRLRRAVNSQKCIRAGGKHNDLEDVGKDTYHHTFFEMLGNWSFGDYFKDEAIAWAWELLTKVYRLPADRLYATYFRGDEGAGLAPDHEARDLWLRFLPASRVLPGNMKDNFWEMGETGPCGPCSEIHFDRIGGRDAASRVNTGDPDVLEIWNLVFIQFNREEDGGLKALPSKHVDTGMGFERLVSVIHNVRSNYDTDVFAPIFMAIERVTRARAYMGRLGEADKDGVDTAYRVIADHIRTLTFAITDGATPSNEGRGYVLRRILRRAVRYGRQKLSAPAGFFHLLVPTVVERMGGAFPELRKDPSRVMEVIREEEESFGRTLDRGIKLFDEAASGTRAGGAISGEDAFRLSDTYGFPIDLTVLMAGERGLGVDLAGYDRHMAEARVRSRGGAKEHGAALVLTPDAIARLRHMGVGATGDTDKFHARDVKSRIAAIWNGKDFDQRAGVASGGHVVLGLLLESTNFYAEMGGQQADEGSIAVIGDPTRRAHEIGEFIVEHVQAFGDYVLHVGRVLRGELRSGDRVLLRVDGDRRKAVSANHTSTHLLNLVLRSVLGEHVEQKGSLVAADRLRFDFSHTGPMTPEEISRVERGVGEAIEANLTVHADLVPLAKARTIAGVRAVFGETYPDPVRVVSIGPRVSDLVADPGREAWKAYSVELCGGTHVGTTRETSSFVVLSETGVAKGVRRIEAATGVGARAAGLAADALADRIVAATKLDDAAVAREAPAIGVELDKLPISLVRKAALRRSLESLQERVKRIQKAQAAAARERAVGMARGIAQSASMSLREVVVEAVDAGSDRAALQDAVKVVQDACPRSAVMLLSTDVEGGKVAFIASVPKYLVERGLRAGDWVRHVASLLDGNGGGKPESAQGSGTNLARVREALDKGEMFAHERLQGA